MINSRQEIQSFIKDNFQDHELKHKATITTDMEPRLKYFMIDRYRVNILSHESLNKLIGFVNSLWDVEIYFAFGFLCIGYTDNEFGNGRNCMRLNAFFPEQLCDLNDQVDKDFVQPVLPAAAEMLDKPGNVYGVV